MPENLDEWREWGRLALPGLRILAIWVLAAVAVALAGRVFALKLRLFQRAGAAPPTGRLATLFGVLRYAVNVTVLVLAVLMTLGQLGISVAPLLATAGIAGIAIGFGAQSLVKDFFNGVCLLVENQISEGDSVDIAGKSGVVERMTLRHVRLRDYDGAVHFIPNSTISVLTNRSREFAYAVSDIVVARELELERVYAHMRAVAADLRRDPVLGAALLDDIDIAGVEKMDDGGVTVRSRLKVVPPRQWRVRREFLRRLQPLLDEEKRSLGEAQASDPGRTAA